MIRPEIYTNRPNLHPAREALNSWGSFILLFLLSAAPAIAFAILILSSYGNTYSWWDYPAILISITVLCAFLSSPMAPPPPIIDGKPKTTSLAAHTLRYCSLQLIFVPVIYISLFAAYWLFRIIYELFYLLF